MDGVLCECALCTFPDKPAAVREIARVLRPGGVLALSDMTAEPDRLPRELRSLDASIACIADARPLDALAALIGAAGLFVTRRERHDAALRELVERAPARLRLARALRSSILAGSIERALTIATAAEEAIPSSALGYGILVARRSDALRWVPGGRLRERQRSSRSIIPAASQEPVSGSVCSSGTPGLAAPPIESQ